MHGVDINHKQCNVITLYSLWHGIARPLYVWPATLHCFAYLLLQPDQHLSHSLRLLSWLVHALLLR